MKNRTTRTREHRTRPGEEQRLGNVRLTIPKLAIDEMHELERRRNVTGEDIFMAGLVHYRGR